MSTKQSDPADSPPPRIADKTADWAFILQGAREFATEAGMLPYVGDVTSPSFCAAIKTVVNLEQVTVFLLDDGQRVLGGLGMAVTPYLWNPTKISAEELFWWCHPSAPPKAAMALLKAGKDFARLTGATILTFHSLETSPPGVDVAYRRMGLARVQSTYVGSL